jgi:hypothetical protein
MRKTYKKEARALPQWKKINPSDGASWHQLQASINSTTAILQEKYDEDVAMELVGVLNSFQQNIKERGKGD